MKLKYRLRLLHWLFFGSAFYHLGMAFKDMNLKRSLNRWGWFKISTAECIFCKERFNYCFSEGRCSDWMQEDKRVGACPACTERLGTEK